MAEAWYYVDDATNAQQGPCTIPELERLYASSSVTDSTLFWKDGQADWSALSALPSLHAQVTAPPQRGPPALPAKTLPPVPAKPRAGGGGGGAYAAAQASGAVVQSMSVLG
ncbi:conserved unknown protein [Ectocarpus siliculosus]|uniref:GYF domain-containing protein n=1 Tax=Ectocarpus siliculosus TaxID=2880 RepID=D7G547_ECTSI|nr:conserved unknown protein [Ectocarpus siliculosus]|eukprot:CBJ33810.1 conserved unknown protein [Ectocarpus siliculosus]